VRHERLYKEPEENARRDSSDGWLATGDIGTLDETAISTSPDRKKDLFKTAAGKFVAPQPIENPTQGESADSEMLSCRGQTQIHRGADRTEFSKRGEHWRHQAANCVTEQLALDPWVHDLIGREVTQVNAKLAQYETIKRFALLDHDFTFDGGQLTYN